MPELDLPVVLWCAFALALGGTIKGALGVGTPLLTVTSKRGLTWTISRSFIHIHGRAKTTFTRPSSIVTRLAEHC